MTNAYNYVKAANISGIDTNASYPYVTVNSSITSTCSFKPANIGAKITGYVSIPAGDEAEMKRVLAQVGPLAVAIGNIL